MRKLRKIAVEIAHEAFFGNLEAESTIDWVLRRQRPEHAKSDFFIRLAEGTIRNAGTLDAIIRAYSRMDFSKIEPKVLSALRTGVYELVFMENAVPHAPISAMAEAAEVCGSKARSFTKGVLHAIVRGAGRASGRKPKRGNQRSLLQTGDCRWMSFDKNIFPDPDRNRDEYLEAVCSVPAWVVSRIRGDYGKAAEGILRSFLQKPKKALYPNLLINSHSKLEEILRNKGLSVDKSGGDGVLIPRRESALDSFAAYTRGRFIICDELYFKSVRFLDPMPGERICIIKGETQVAALISLLVCSDGHVVFCAEDELAAGRMLVEKERLGLDNLETVVLEPADASSVIDCSFDRVYVEPPSTGTGALGRYAGDRWRIKENDEQRMEKQEMLLQSSLELCAAGGIAVYCTSSILPEENSAIVNNLTGALQHIRIVDTETILPERSGAEGGFMARIVKMSFM